jgi:hypothetical protein
MRQREYYLSAIAFVSHESSDKAAAETVCRALEARQLPCFIAPRDILPGRNYGEAIARAIEDARILVLVLSPNAARSEHVLREVELAARHHLPIVPFRIGAAASSRALDYFLAGAQYLDASSGPIERHAETLAERVPTLLGLSASFASPGSAPALSDDSKLDELPDAAAERLVGTSVDRFTLQRLLGQGGSGFAFLAWDSRFNEHVCLKLFYPARHKMPNTWALCRASLKALASLRHPGIISIVDFGDYQASWRSMWIAMDLVDGRNLAEWASTDRTLGQRLDLAIAICTALQAAHTHNYVDDFGLSRRGVYHGDLKPGNVLVRSDDSPVLLDFMLPDLQRTIAAAQNGADRSELPITSIMGTSGFMAPEQERYGLVSPQSDIYSLGMTFSVLFAPDDHVSAWFGLTEREQADRGLLSRLWAKWSTSIDLNSVTRNVNGLPKGLVAMIRQMLETDLAARTADVGFVRQALCGIRAGQ